MSHSVVTPERNNSVMPRRLPTGRFRGDEPMLRWPHVLSSQVCSGKSSARPRKSVIGIWVWASMRPGITRHPVASTDRRATVGRSNLRARAERNDRVAVNRQCALLQNATAFIHGDDDAAEHEDIGRNAIGTGVIGVAH